MSRRRSSGMVCATAAPLLVTPGSEQIRATIERDGQMQALEDIGATVLANACGPCIGQWRRADEAARAPNTIVTSYNRNFPRRNDGQPTTMNFIASPELVTAFAAAGRLSFNPLTDTLTGGRRHSVQAGAAAARAGGARGRLRARAHRLCRAAGRMAAISSWRSIRTSERLQRSGAMAGLGRRDFLDMPVLVKTKGKTTTDHISPAGPWLRYRGHLDRFSDNMFMGAINAFTGAAGKGRNVLTGAAGQPFANIARDYKARGIKWVVIGDANYGEGSSREHAALSPRLLGGVRGHCPQLRAHP